MKFALSLSLTALALLSSTLTFSSRLENLVIDGKISRESLFDPSISPATLAQSIGAAGIDLKTALSNAIRMTPGTHFTQVGILSSFDYIPTSHNTRHAILYYIPKSIQNELYGVKADVAPVLVIMHGGGASTGTYEAAKSVAKIYMQDFIAFAESSKTILIAPSTSLGWTAHAGTFLIREINAMARRELNISGDRMYLFGHSMGAMGITRTASNMADEFAGFLPTAGGMPAWGRTEANLRPYLNINFTHINGKKDHFREFGPDLLATEIVVKALAAKENMSVHFKALFHEGEHNYDLPMTLYELQKLMSVKRNLYQPKLFGYMGRGVLPNSPNPIKDFTYPHFFWARARSMPDVGKSFYTHWNFEINKVENAIELTNFSGAEFLKEITFFISSSMLDLTRPVKVITDQKQIVEVNLDLDAAKTIEIVRERSDPQFLFDQSVNYKL